MIFSIFCLIIAIAPTFAMDNDTAIGVHNEDIVGADIYFDANVEKQIKFTIDRVHGLFDGKGKKMCLW